MRRLLYIPATGGAADLLYKTEQIQIIFPLASGQMITRLRAYSGDAILEQVTTPVPGIGDVLVTVAPIQSSVRFYITISRSTGGSSSTTQSGATTYPNPGFSETLDVEVVAYP